MTPFSASLIKGPGKIPMFYKLIFIDSYYVIIIIIIIDHYKLESSV